MTSEEPVEGDQRVDPVVRATQVTTVVVTVILVAATVRPFGAVLAAAVVVSVAALVAGSVLFLVGFLRAVGRSRDETIPMAGLVWLAGTTPSPAVRPLRSAVVVQSVVALTCAAVRPFTGVAFGVLTPMLGLGILVFWSGTHGVFTDPGTPGGAIPRAEGHEGPGMAGSRDEDPDDFDQLFRRRNHRR